MPFTGDSARTEDLYQKFVLFYAFAISRFSFVASLYQKRQVLSLFCDDCGHEKDVPFIIYEDSIP